MTPFSGRKQSGANVDFNARADCNRSSLLSDDNLLVGADPEVSQLYAYQRQVLGYLLHGRSLQSSGPDRNPNGASALTSFASNASDLLIYSPTGFGKTLTYIAPIAHFLKTTRRSGNQFCIERRPDGVAALVLVPTRELANQVSVVAQQALLPFNGQVVTLAGGVTIDEERRELQSTPAGIQGPDVVVCVAPRLAAHAKPTSQKGDSCRWNCLRYLVIDEADRLLADGYGDWITAVRCMTAEQDILRGAKLSAAPLAAKKALSLLGDYWHPAPTNGTDCPEVAHEKGCSSDLISEPLCDLTTLSGDAFVRPFHLQKIICTATDVKSFRGIRSLRLHHPLCVRAQLEKDLLKQKVLLVTASGNAEEVLKKCVRKILRRRNHQCLLFCRSAAEVHQIYKTLSIYNNATGLIGALTGADSAKRRERTFRAFLRGDTRLLVSSDVSARGLNVKSVTHVVQFGLPVNADEYVHRVGRTARCGLKGKSVLIVRKSEVAKYLKMHQTIVELRPTSKIKIKRL